MKYRTEIVIHRFGQQSEDWLTSLTQILQDRFQLPARIGRSLRIPAGSLSASRRQYLSTAFLDSMQSEFRDDPHLHLGITDVDLFVPDLGFVFGEASPGTGVAVFSLHRLRPGRIAGSEDVNLLRSRSAIEAVHEMGHIFGLEHCKNPRCVMWFSNRLEENDRKGSEFCPLHRAELDALLKTWRSQAPQHLQL